jgi:multiple sugar transport system permease protein
MIESVAPESASPLAAPEHPLVRRLSTALPTPSGLTRRASAWVRGGGLSTLLLALPMLLLFTYFAWIPIGRAIVMSFQETNMIDPARWVGLDNFRDVLDDPLLWTAIRNTGQFVVMALIFGFPIPIILAICMNELVRAKGLFSALAFLPVVIPPVASILLWRVFYDAGPDGLFNTIFGWVGLGPYPWIQSADTSMMSIVLLATWSNAGATVIIYLAALASVRSDLYEAAETDGAGIWQRVRYVTLPQMRNVLFVTLILQVIGTCQVFTEPFLLTRGGPSNSTMTILLLVYQTAFGTGGSGDYGGAAALSVMLVAFLAVLSGVYFRATRSWSSR